MRAILHIHTCYSFDSNLSPAEIINFAKNLDIDFIGITDHNTIKGAIEAKKLTNSPNIIIGAEYFTEVGDIMALFIKEEIKEREALSVINEIKKQAGIAVLPHPYREHNNIRDEVIEKCDAIEVFNARSTKIQNDKALELAKKFNKPIIVGSDAHFLHEIPLTMIEFNGDIKKAILNGECKIIKNENSPLYYKIITGLIKFYKTKDIKLPIKWIKKLLTKNYFFMYLLVKITIILFFEFIR